MRLSAMPSGFAGYALPCDFVASSLDAVLRLISTQCYV
jgi:hypothetical protein